MMSLNEERNKSLMVFYGTKNERKKLPEKKLQKNFAILSKLLRGDSLKNSNSMGLNGQFIFFYYF